MAFSVENTQQSQLIDISRNIAVKSFSVLFQLMFSCSQLQQQEILALWFYSLGLNRAPQLSRENMLAIAECSFYASSYIFIWELIHLSKDKSMKDV